MKYNFNTGYLCPLCRNPFIKIKVVHQRNSIFSHSLTHSPWRHMGYSVPRPVTRPSLIQGNRIIQPRRIQSIIQPEVHSNIEQETRRITKFIDELNYETLKRELQSRGLSTRGYLRTSFERRLFNAMRNQ